MININTRKMMEFYFNNVEECCYNIPPMLILKHFGFTNATVIRDEMAMKSVADVGHEYIVAEKREHCGDVIAVGCHYHKSSYTHMFRVTYKVRYAYGQNSWKFG